jgi:type IV pilus assembly protein PilA
MNQILNKKRNLLDKKGFSLVELIIVIAIMAVLVAILVPQYLKYVDKSKQSADDTTVDAVLKASQVALTDEAIAAAVGALSTDPTIVINTTNTTITDGTTGSLITAELTSTLGTGWQTKKITSNAYKTNTAHDVFTITIAHTTGVVTGAWS